MESAFLAVQFSYLHYVNDRLKKHFLLVFLHLGYGAALFSIGTDGRTDGQTDRQTDTSSLFNLYDEVERSR